MLVFVLFSVLLYEEFLCWGWCVLFLFGGIVVIVVWWIWCDLDEMLVFFEEKRKGCVLVVLLCELFCNYKVDLVKVVFVMLIVVLGLLFNIYLFGYVVNVVGLVWIDMLWMISFVIVVVIVMMFVWVICVDWIGCCLVYLISVVVFVLFIWFYIWVIS